MDSSNVDKRTRCIVIAVVQVKVGIVVRVLGIKLSLKVTAGGTHSPSPVSKKFPPSSSFIHLSIASVIDCGVSSSRSFTATFSSSTSPLFKVETRGIPVQQNSYSLVQVRLQTSLTK